MADTDPNTIDDIAKLRIMIEELQAYTRMQDLSFECRVDTAIQARDAALRAEIYSDAHGAGHDAGHEEATVRFSNHISTVRKYIDATLDLHLSDYTD